MDTKTWQEELEDLWSALDSDRLTFFPVRHHSPACSWHLARLICERKPTSILLEGPASFTRSIPTLLDPSTRAPIALYTQFIDSKRRTVSHDDGLAGDGPPPRYSSFFPMCDYSPELVALREGHAIGARLAFFDLDFPDQILAESAVSRPQRLQIGSLLDESHLVHSAYLNELAHRRRCRDTHELWDRLFECDFQSCDTSDFMRKLAAYCFFARAHTTTESLERDGTLAREASMLGRLKTEQKRLRRRQLDESLLVVTGGFHTPALVLGAPSLAKTPRRQGGIEESDTLRAVIPYSFEQLDALHGYAAGMPSPAFYQRLWENRDRPQAAALEEMAREFLVELPRMTRRAKAANPVSTADAIAALYQARALAGFRGHPGPLREDVLDGIRSCFVQGESDASGSMILDMSLELLRGDTVGSVPENTEELPILTDFARQAKGFSLNLESTVQRDKALEIYRKPRHRQASHLLRRLQFLEVPFARFVAGPDFVTGTGMDLLVEHWSYVWAPQTAGRLVECTVYGGTIEEAVSNRLDEKVRVMREEGGASGAREAINLLTECCILGMHERASDLAPEIEDMLLTEASFAECAAAAAQLQLILRFQGPLQAGTARRLPEMLKGAFHRCCRLVSSLERVPEGAVDSTLDGLARIRELLVQSRHEEAGIELDQELFWSAVRRGLDDTACHPAIRGGLLGLAFSAGIVDGDDLMRRLEPGLTGRTDQGSTAPHFLRGLLTLNREITWQFRDFMDRFDAMLRTWDDDEFYRALPYLRLAFSSHTPQETDRVAQMLNDVGEGGEIGDLYRRDVEEEQIVRNTAIAARVHESLQADGLLKWIHDESA